MSARTVVAKGFTLVEILIVVVILGILAAIVIPQFTNAAGAANVSSLRTQLQTFRSQIELYQSQHGGQYPLLADMNADVTGDGIPDWQPFTQQHSVNPDGSPNYAPTPNDILVGPYMRQPSRNPFTQQGAARSTLIAAGGTAGAGAAFEYNQADGGIRALMPLQQAITNNILPAGTTTAPTNDADYLFY